MGRFFFGGDMAFSYNDQKPEFSSYIIHSNKFPQQTSLLGMLRFLILRNDEQVFDSEKQEIRDNQKDQATLLIGPKSFMVNGTRGDFGKIKSLGPCFFQAKKDEQWTDLEITPKDELKEYKEKDDEWGKPLNVDFSGCSQEKTHAVINGKKVDVPNMNYNAKGNYPTCYQHGNVVIKENDIFKEEITNGIDRDIETGKVDDNALFKKISYRLKDDFLKDGSLKDVFRFAFYAEVELDGFEKYSGQLVSVGGDSSQFVIGIEKCPEEEKEEQLGCGKRVILTSPSYLTKEDFKKEGGEQLVRFAITDTMPFKCMQTTTKEVKTYNKSNTKYKYDYSTQYFLFVPGSVFYFKTEEDAEAFADRIKSHADFHQIGYNHCLIK